MPGLGRSPGEGNDNPHQYSCLENSMDRRAWWATVQGNLKESDMIERLPPPPPICGCSEITLRIMGRKDTLDSHTNLWDLPSCSSG